MKESDINIFIVEDDKFYAEIIRNTMINEGYSNIQLFESGDDYFNHTGTPPNIVILDHMLGQMSGLHVLQKIKQLDTTIQVIFLSGQENMEVVVNALKYGAIDYIEKTEKRAMTRLVVMIEKAIAKQKSIRKNSRIESLKNWFLIN